jgi:class 3 adenylate cyclase
MRTDVQLAVLFADVVGSTRLYERLGDTAARELIAASLDLMKDATRHHGGTVVKTMGDEIMATFAHASDAISAAARMQRRIGEDSKFTAAQSRIALRIGCHCGPVVWEQHDVFGSTVHTANRLTSQAKAGQIMVTEAVVSRLPPDWRSSIRHVDVATLRGFQDEVELYEVIWHAEDVTNVLRLPAAFGSGRTRATRLRLSVNGTEIALCEEGGSIQLGRADTCELVVQGSLVSRLHARIEVSKGGFRFVDQSTNGSFVHVDGGDSVFVRRDSMTLEGNGLIGLGREPGDQDPGSIRYACED